MPPLPTVEPVTMHSLVTNPPGERTRQVAARHHIIDSLERGFRELVADPERRRMFKTWVARIDPPGTYAIWVKVPSSKYEVDFDVIFWVDVSAVRAVASAPLRMYCNSPGWVFSLGYVANKQGFLGSGWESALGRAATEPPKVLNPEEISGFDKTVFSAIRWALGPAGLISAFDLARAAEPSHFRMPTPDDPGITAEGKLREYGLAADKSRLAARKAKEKKLRDEVALRLEKERAEKNRNRRESRRSSVGRAGSAPSVPASGSRKRRTT
jgi:hypothetical protein